MKKFYIYIFTAALLYVTQSTHATTIFINEIMQNPSAVSDSVGEWFELYNYGLIDVDIDGWTIEDSGSDSHLIDNGGSLVIAAGSFLVLGRNTNFGTNGGVALDYGYGTSLTLANGDDELILLDDLLTEIDRVEWDGGPSFPDPTGASMGLTDPMADNNNGSNWAVSTVAFGAGDLGTPGSCNSYAEQVCSNIPEPSTLALLSLGLAGLGFAKRKKA